MKLSCFNLDVEYSGFHLIYNTLKSSCVIFKPEDYFLYQNYGLPPDNISDLLRLGIYLQDEDDDWNNLLIDNKKIADALSFQESAFVILTTTNCNAKCYYCFEKGITHHSISSNDIKLICEFIIKTHEQLIFKDNPKLSVQWFGGEPLLNCEAIDQISRVLQNYCNQNGITYTSDIITNGSLITPAVAKKMFVEWKITKCQITLDGNKEKYENIKKFPFENSFDQVIDAIKLLIKNQIQVAIRLNYDGTDTDDMVSLIQLLHDKSIKGCGVYLQRLYGKYSSFDTSYDGDIAILDKLYECGYYKPSLRHFKRRVVSCGAATQTYFVINADKTIHKCSHFLNTISNDAEIGKLSIETMFPKNWENYFLEEKCYKCAFTPICMGGCISQRIMGNYPCYYNKATVDYQLKLFLKQKLTKMGLV